MVLFGVTTPKVSSKSQVGLRGLVSDELFFCLPARNVNCPQIALMASAPSTPTKRGEVDTSRPYADVREAIQRFDHTPGSLKNSAEKRVYESPVVGSLREQLAEALSAKERAEHEKDMIGMELMELRTKLEHALGADDSGDVKKVYEELLESKKKVDALEAQIAESTLETEQAVKKAELAEGSAIRVLETVERAALLHQEDEVKIVDAQNHVESLSSELAGARGEVSGLSGRIAELQAELRRLGEEVRALREAEATALASLGDTSSELRALESRLRQSEDERNALQATNRYLEPELRSTREELQALKSEEGEGEEKYRVKIEAARASEVRARELVSGLLEAFGQVSAEAIEAEVVKDAVNGEIERLREETRSLRQASEAAEKQASEVLKEVETAKAGEASAVEALRSLTGEEDDTGELEKVHEIESSTGLTIAEADAAAGAARAREEELRVKLDTARAEIEASKTQVKQANEKAASAEAAKSAVEGELRRWRSENEERRKQAQAQVHSQVQAHTGASGFGPPPNGVVDEKKSEERIVKKDEHKVISDERRLPAQRHGESLAEVLQINLAAKQDHHEKQKKKLKLMARLGAVFTPKKKQPST